MIPVCTWVLVRHFIYVRMKTLSTWYCMLDQNLIVLFWIIDSELELESILYSDSES